jgi:hypothetical protein
VGRWSYAKSEKEDKNKRKHLVVFVNMNEMRKYFYPLNEYHYSGNGHPG